MTPAERDLPTVALRPPPADPEPDPDYCDYLAAATEAGHDLHTPAELRPDLRRAHDLLQAVRAAGRLSSTPHLPAAPHAPRRVGRFEVGRQLGRGGAGAVFEARDPTLNRTVALKVLHPALAVDHEWGARFRAEGPALARLRHPNVVQVFEAGEADGVSYLAMELLPGPDLHTKLTAGPLPARAAAELVAALADGLAHAHAAGILHRDLKPANVLLDPTGPKLADFGLAASLLAGGSGLTATGEVVGTPNYLPPEALDGRVGPAADVYGLGAVLYECLTGVPPVVGSNPAVILMQVRNSEPSAPRSVNPEVPRDLDTICRKCLSKRPEKRYPTAAAVAADLRAFLAGRPVSARPPGLVERGAKWVRRRPATAAGLAAGLLVTAAGLAGWAQHTRRLAASLDAERQAVALADRRGQHLTGVVDVLRGVFADLDVEQLRDNKVPLERALADRLVTAAGKLDADGLGEPAELASLRHQVGETLLSLGFPEKAAPLFQAAADAWAADPAHGPDHEFTLGALSNLASVDITAGRPDRATPRLQDVHARSVRRLGPDAPQTLTTQLQLEAALASAGREAEAHAVSDDLFPRMTRALGPDHPHTLEAEAYWLAHQPAGQPERYAGLVERCQRVLGSAHPQTLNLRATHATALVEAGRAVEAVPLYRALADEAAAAGGPDRPDAVRAVFGLGWACDRAGDQPAAGVAYADAVTRVERRGHQLPTAGEVVAEAAGHAERHGKLAQAEGWRRKWAAACEAQKADSDAHAAALEALGGNLLAQGKWAEAEPVLKSAHAAWGKRPDGSKAAAGRLADLYAARGRQADAARWRAVADE